LLLGDFVGRNGFGDWQSKLQTVDLGLQVARRQVPVDLHGDARVAVPQDALDGGGIGAGHHEEARRRVAEVMETQRADLGFGPEQVIVLGAAEAWPDADALGQQAVGQVPWGHNLVLLTKLKSSEDRLAHATRALEHGWSRSVLVMHIEQGTLAREGKALTNFEARLPKPQSDLARESLKDPYRFDFLTVGTEADEREIEAALVQHITRFLLELGTGFAFVGRQFHVEVGGEDFYIDLLFYHFKLRAYIVIELKATNFKPEHTGQLGFYLTAVDAQVKAPEGTGVAHDLDIMDKLSLVNVLATTGIATAVTTGAALLSASRPRGCGASRRPRRRSWRGRTLRAIEG
jgi:predicted nuclease of restriction endonuclease-like (RecB) superfamily